MNQDHASTIALGAVVFIIGDDTLRSRFMALSGSDVDDIRARINETDFQAAALDFLLGHEPDLIAFCESSGIAPDTPLKAKQVLAGQSTWESI